MKGCDGQSWLKMIQDIQATMLRVTEDGSCCSDKYMQALCFELFIFCEMWFKLFCKFEYQIQYCFEISALDLAVKMSNKTQFSIMEFIYWPLEGMWSVQWNLDLPNLYMKKSSVWQTISLAPVTVNYAEKNFTTKPCYLVIANTLCQSLGSSLYQNSTVVWHYYSIFLVQCIK